MLRWFVLASVGCVGGKTGDTDPVDVDGDGFATDVDCDDADGAVNPGATEACGDGRDNDCDGLVDDTGEGAIPAWVDQDLDGYGDPATPPQSVCALAPGLAAADDDCDDADPLVGPEVELLTDGDGDGWGAGTGALACPVGGSPLPGDCDDADAAVHPTAPELCDGRDDDCDPATPDEALASIAGVGSFADLQDALDAASDGDEIVVCPGTYAGPFKMRHWGTLRSSDGAASTVLQGDGERSVLKIVPAVSGPIAIDGFTITGGGGKDTYYWTDTGGGIALLAGDPFTLANSVLTGNESNRGGGIDVLSYPSTADIVDTEISGNTARHYGGGIGLVGCSTALTLTRVDLSGNASSELGGGLYAYCLGGVGSSVSLIESTVEGNSAPNPGYIDGAGGGLMLIQVPGTADAASVIRGNSAVSGGGVAVTATSFVGGQITGNSATRGGGVELRGGTIADASITGNSAATGGGVYVGYESASLDGLDISGNTAASGGGVALVGSDVTLGAGCRLADNVATANGGGAWLDAASTLASAGADWGTSGVDDNAPEDVWAGSAWSWDGAATFSCAAGCAP